MSPRLRLVISLAAAAFLSVPRNQAHAAEQRDATEHPPEEVLDLFRRGLVEYDAHRYQGAITLFEEAYRLSNNNALLFNIAQAWRLAGNCANAKTYYTRFLATAAPSTDHARAVQWLEQLGSCGTPPVQLPQRVPMQPAAMQLAARPTARPTGHIDWRLFSGAALLGGGAALGVAAGLATSRAMSSADRTSMLFDAGGMWDDSAAAIDQQGRSARTEALILASAAVLSLALGALLARSAYKSSHPVERTP